LKKGFTLIEVTLVVALMGILFAISLPRFGFELTLKIKLEKTAKGLQADLRFTRWLAVTKNDTYILKIYPEQKEYKIYKNSISDENQVSQARSYDSKIVISGDSYEYGFEPLGNLKSDSPSKITLIGGEYTFEININPSTGRVSVTEKT
jgi:prepilin-type N-terminal cleavage/methylation domain-containing protein